MLFLVVNISYHRSKISFTEGQDSIFILPVKLEIGFDHVVDVMRTIPFHISDEFRRRYFGRNRNSKMSVIFHPADSMDESTHALRLCRDNAI